jgi:hypothetical protein
MLPFGTLEFDWFTRFTRSEQVLCMTRWSIARSPLIFGGDMTRLDDFTLGLLTNPEVLAVNQASTNNRQISRRDDLIVWAADVPDSPDRYVAFFNAQDNESRFDLTQAVYKSPVLRGNGGQQAEITVPVRSAKRLVLIVDNGGDNEFYDNAAWIEPKLSGPGKTLPLTELEWTSATTGWGAVAVDRTVDGQPLTWAGAKATGIGTHSISAIAYDLPEGYDHFTARGVVTPTVGGTASLQFLVLVDPRETRFPEQSPVSVAFEELGIQGPAKVRDLWKREDVGVLTNHLSSDVPLKSARLYRVSP